MLKIFKTLLLLLALTLTMSSCEQQLDVIDLNYTLHVEKTSSAPHLPKVPADIRININGSDAIKKTKFIVRLLDVSFTPVNDITLSDFSGYIEIKKTQLKIGDYVEYVFDTPLLVTTCGNNAGNYTVKFSFETASETTIITDAFTVAPSKWDFTTSITNHEIKHSTTYPFTFTITQALQTKPYSKFTVQNLITPPGTLKIATKDYQWLTSLNTISPGTHNIEFTPKTVGQNTLVFELTDNDNNKSKFEIPFIVKPFELQSAIKNISNDDINISVPVTFDLSIFEEKYPADSLFKYRFIQIAGNGTLQQGELPILANTSYESKDGNYPFSYIPTKGYGAHCFNLEIADAFGQTKLLPILLNVSPTEIIALSSISSASTEINTGADFTADINEFGYSGKFFLSYESSSIGTLTVNGKIVVANSEIEVATGKNTFTYTPSQLGPHALTFDISDEHEQKASFNVAINSTHKAMSFATSAALSSYINRPSSINITASGATPFAVSYSGGNGSMLRNGTIIPPNTASELLVNETWTYTPTSTGTHTLIFTAIDKNGQISTSTATTTCIESPISLSLNPASSSTIINTPTSATLNLTNTAQDKDLRVEWSCDGGGALNIISGNKYATGSLKLNYTPNGNGGQKNINIKVSDNYGASKNIQWPINVTYPVINFHATSVSSYVNMPVDVSYSVSKDQYAGSFYVTATTSTDGSISSSNATVAAGTHKITYTSSTIGQKTINFSVRDNDGSTQTATSKVNVSYPPIYLNSTKVDFNDKYEARYIVTIDNLADYPINQREFNAKVINSSEECMSHVSKKIYDSNTFEVMIASDKMEYIQGWCEVEFSNIYGTKVNKTFYLNM